MSSMRSKVIDIQFSFIVAALFFLGCNPVFYAPSVYSVPDLDSNTKQSVELLYREGEESTGFGLVANYRLSNSMVVQSQVTLVERFEGNIDAVGRGALGNFALYYSKEFAERSFVGIRPSLTMAQFSNEAQYLYPSPDSTLIIGKLFARYVGFGLMPYLGYDGKILDFSVGGNLTSIDYYNVYGELFSNGNNQVPRLITTSPLWFFEPGISLGLTKNNLTFRGSFCGSILLTQVWTDYHYDRISFSAGLVYRF